MIRLLSILCLLCGIARSQTVTETELWTLRFNSSVTPAMKTATVKAATIIGWMCDRQFPPDVPEPYPRGKAFLDIYAQPGMGWTIAETSVNGPAWVINGRTHPLRPTVTINADNWNGLMDVFVYGPETAAFVMFHELLHALGMCYLGSINNGITPPVATETQWFGPAAVALYRSEIDPTATFIPLDAWWHVAESAVPLASLSNILNARLDYMPEKIYAFEFGFLQDYGIATVPPVTVNFHDLYVRRRSPWNMQPIIINQ